MQRPVSRHRAYLDRKTAARRRNIDAFAEALARGMTLVDASAAIGVSRPAGQNYLLAIRAGLGPQAV